VYTEFEFENLQRPLLRPLHKWEDNIKMDLKELGIQVRTSFLFVCLRIMSSV
jgi:hypothetical protein